MKIPLHDIYLQEFFFYGYCIVTKDRRAFFESDEGHTYVKMVHQQKHSLKLLNFLYCEKDRDTVRWSTMVKACIKKIRISSLDTNETEFVDLDYVFNLYLDEYKMLRKENQKDIK